MRPVLFILLIMLIPFLGNSQSTLRFSSSNNDTKNKGVKVTYYKAGYGYNKSTNQSQSKEINKKAPQKNIKKTRVIIEHHQESTKSKLANNHTDTTIQVKTVYRRIGPSKMISDKVNSQNKSDNNTKKKL